MAKKTIDKAKEELKSIESEIVLKAQMLIEHDNSVKAIKEKINYLNEEKSTLEADINELEQRKNILAQTILEDNERAKRYYDLNMQKIKDEYKSLKSYISSLEDQKIALDVREGNLNRIAEKLSIEKEAVDMLNAKIVKKELKLEEKEKDLELSENSINSLKKSLDESISKNNDSIFLSQSTISMYNKKYSELKEKEKELNEIELRQRNILNSINTEKSNLISLKLEYTNLLNEVLKDKEKLRLDKEDILKLKKSNEETLFLNQRVLNENRKTLNMIKDKQMTITNLVIENRLEEKVKEYNL